MQIYQKLQFHQLIIKFLCMSNNKQFEESHSLPQKITPKIKKTRLLKQKKSDQDLKNDNLSMSRASDSRIQDKWKIQVVLPSEDYEQQKMIYQTMHSKSAVRNDDEKYQNRDHQLKKIDMENSRRNTKSQNTHQIETQNDIDQLSSQKPQGPFVKKLAQQNAKLHSRNKKLWEQLKDLSQKVDTELNRRKSSSSIPKVRKQRVFSTQSLNNMELQNAYKQCQIYKKQIQTLKRKELLFNEEKVNSLSSQLHQQKLKNEQLIQQLKTLKHSNARIRKMKGDSRQQEITRMKDQNTALRKENKKLRDKIEEQQKEEKSEGLNKITKNKVNDEEIELQRSKKKIDFKKEELRNVEVSNRMQANNKKIKLLTFNNKKQDQLIVELKQQVQDQKKQIQKLQEAIRKLKTKKSEKQQKNFQNQTKKSKGNHNTGTKQLTERNSSREISEMKANISNHKKYPYKLQYGPSIADSISFYKWSHLSYASKVKQIQVMMHPNGHVRALNFRYEKGEPPKALSQGGRYAIFSCPDLEEYIKQFSGGFYNGTLAYIKIKTNKNRQASFCRHQLDNQEEEELESFEEPIDELTEEKYQTDTQKQQDESYEQNDDESEQRENDSESEGYNLKERRKSQQKNRNSSLQYIYKEQDQYDEEELVSQDEKLKHQSISRRTNQKRVNLHKKNCEKFIFGEGHNQFIMGFFGESTNQGIVKLGCLIGLNKNGKVQ